MEQVLTLQAKSNYGKVSLYPACEHSKVLAKIAKTLTLTDHTLGLAEQLGYKITVLPPVTEFSSQYAWAIEG